MSCPMTKDTTSKFADFLHFTLSSLFNAKRQAKKLWISTFKVCWSDSARESNSGLPTKRTLWPLDHAPGLNIRGVQGRRHGGDWEGTVPPLLTKVIFVNRLKPMRKYLGYGGGGVTLPTILEFQPEFDFK